MLSTISRHTIRKSLLCRAVINNGFSSLDTRRSYLTDNASVKALIHSPNIRDKSFRVQTLSTVMAPVMDTSISEALNNEAEIVRRVKSHLLEVDSSKNGQIDAETLKTILRKVGGFSDKEVLELGELFYAARGGAAASHEDFLRGVAQVIREKDNIGTSYVDEKVASEESNAVVHRRVQKTNHPLGLGSCSTEYMFGKQRGVYSDEVRMIAT
jgi:hypothetical protein